MPGPSLTESAGLTAGRALGLVLGSLSEDVLTTVDVLPGTADDDGVEDVRSVTKTTLTTVVVSGALMAVLVVVPP